jgi:TonB family protein
MSADWAKLEAHVVNGAFPLQRCVGSSDHGGVFLTQSATHAASTAALKLIRYDPASADAQLARWRAAVDHSHPHLIRIFEAGECHVDGLHCLYVLMEYAEQNLAQLLEQRALSEPEAREMLVPTLSTLAYLHGNQLVHGQLKPSNILVVEDQVKLASDTVRAVGATAIDPDAESAYDAPETREGRGSTASDIWALGVTLCEAFARRRPSGLRGTGEVELPSELPAAFRGAVGRCLSRNPDNRPQVSELQAWLRGESAMPEPPNPRPARTSTVRLVIRAQILPKEEPVIPVRRGSSRAIPLVLGAVALLALGWVGYRVFRAEPSSAPVAEEAAQDVAPQPTEPIPPPVPESVPPRSEVASVGVEAPAPERASSTTATSALNEVVPDVPRSALQTIRGTIRVSVRVIVDKDGTVIAATADEPGPSRYFERLSLEASKKWKFAPADAEDQRLMLVRFNYRRTGATASASPVQ